MKRLLKEDINKISNDYYNIIGYKVMGVIDGKITSGANSRLELKTKIGEIMKMPGNGIYLSTNKPYVLDYYSGLSDDEVLITFKFNESDIITGNINDKEPELSVKEALIINIENI